MTNVLVTGAAGFIGLNLVEHLLTNTSWNITGLDKDLTVLEHVDKNLRGKVRWLELDLLEERDLHNAVRGVDFIFHLAAETHNDTSIVDPNSFISSNVIGTFNLIQAARKYDVRYHHVSTDEVFGDLAEDEQSFNEETAYNPSSPYSATKAASDHLVRAWTRTYGLRASISNCSNNYGPWQKPEKLIPRLITRSLSGLPLELYGSGQNVRDWIHVEDHCSALLAIANRGGIGQTYLVGTNNEMTNLEIARIIASIQFLGGPEIEFVGDRPGHDFRYSIDARKIRNELGWETRPRDLSSELEKLAYWYAAREEWWKPLAKKGQHAW